MYEVIGYRRASGTSKKTGKPYSGYFVHLSYSDSQTVGVCTEQVFLSDMILEDRNLMLGDRVNLSYNKSGFLTKVEFV